MKKTTFFWEGPILVDFGSYTIEFGRFLVEVSQQLFVNAPREESVVFQYLQNDLNQKIKKSLK